jgi:hypothetical protein
VRLAGAPLERAASRLSWCIVLTLSLVARQSAAGGLPTTLPASNIEHAVIATLATSNTGQAEVLLDLDLTHPFATTSQWTLVITQAPGPI